MQRVDSWQRSLGNLGAVAPHSAEDVGEHSNATIGVVRQLDHIRSECLSDPVAVSHLEDQAQRKENGRPVPEEVATGIAEDLDLTVCSQCEQTFARLGTGGGDADPCGVKIQADDKILIIPSAPSPRAMGAALR